MKVYGVRVGDDSTMYFGTKREAMRHARAEASSVPESITDIAAAEVEEVTMAPITKALIVKLVNVAGEWADDSRIIARINRKGRIISE